MLDLKKEFLKKDVCFELCAGDGRMTKNFLSTYYKEIDVHDQIDQTNEWNDINQDMAKGRGRTKC